MKQRERKKKHARGQQEDTTEILDPPPNKSKRASSSLRSTKGKKVKSSEDTKHVNTDIVPEVIPHVRQAKGAPSATVDGVTLQKSPQRVGLLREKLLRLAPANDQQNTLTACKDKQATSQPSVPTLNVEPATESENDGEDERGGDEIQIHSKGDKKPNSEPDAAADSHRVAEEEVLSPDITGGSCTPVREPQNSKYDLHCLTACTFGSSG